MKILLDESVPQKLRLIIGHTLRRHGFRVVWLEKNGALLGLRRKRTLSCSHPADQELSYQQNLTRREIALVVLSTNNWSFIKAHVAEIIAAINTATPGCYTEVQIPDWNHPGFGPPKSSWRASRSPVGMPGITCPLTRLNLQSPQPSII